MSQNELKDFADKIMRLLNKEDLTREETKEMFRQVLCDQQPDLQQGAFLAALTAKGESPQPPQSMPESLRPASAPVRPVAARRAPHRSDRESSNVT